MYTPTAPPTFALGKFAGDAEYVRMDGGEALAGLDAWVDQAMMVAHARGEAFRGAFPMAAAYGFLWRPPSREREKDELLCGVIAPSRDAVGRDYPLAIATRVSESLVAGVPHLVPLAFGDFLDGAYGAIDEARSQPMPLATFMARARALAQPTAYEVSAANEEYAVFCRETTLDQAWSLVFPSAPGVAPAVVAALAGVLASSRGRGDAPCTVRLPLGDAGTAAAVLWLDVVRRLARRTDAPSAFWSAEQASLLVCLGPMPTSALAELWCRDQEDRQIFDPVRAVQDAPPASSVPWRGDVTMREWLEALGR